MYIRLNEILRAEPVDSNLTKKHHCFKIVTKSSVLFLSVETSDLKHSKPIGYDSADDCSDHTSLLESWMHNLNTLAKVNSGAIDV